MRSGSRHIAYTLIILTAVGLALAGCQSDSPPPAIAEVSSPSPSPELLAPTAPSAEAATPGISPTALQMAAISLQTPPPGTVVGSPVVITGRVRPLPPDGMLGYSVQDSADRPIGDGRFPVSPAGDGAFVASLTFAEPAGGGQISVSIFQLGPGGERVGAVSLALAVASSQVIFIETPPPGTVVGSPVVLTGRTAHFPFGGQLHYRVSSGAGEQLVAGSFAVAGSPGNGASFNVSLEFELPQGGGPVRVELRDQQLDTEFIAATASLELRVAPPAPPPPSPLPPTPAPPTPPQGAQTIIIDSPAPGTLVGSPVVLRGRTARLPFQGALTYQFVDAAGAVLGAGYAPVSGVTGGPASFDLSLSFRLPPAGGPIKLELSDRDPATGAVAATAVLALQVAPQPVNPTTPAPAPTTPAPAPTTATPTPCIGFSCQEIAGAAVVLAPGGPNDPTFAPCGADPAPRISVETELRASHDLQLGQRAYYFACGFANPASLTAEISGPAGVQALSVLPAVPNPDLAMGAAQAVAPWNATCDLPLGQYTLTMRDGGGGEASLSFNLTPADRERILAIPQAGPAGTAFTFFYCGYGARAGQAVTIDFYFAASEQADGTRDFRPSGSWDIQINGAGWATSSLASLPGDPARAYLLRDREGQLKGFDVVWLVP